MKRFIIILIVASLFGGIAFARGTTEFDTADRGDFYRSARMDAGMGRQGVNRTPGLALDDGDTINIDGTIREIDSYYVLETAGGTYSISAPGFPRSGASIPVGESVEVSGLLVPTALEDCPIDADGHIFVNSAVFGGEEFIFETGSAGGRHPSGYSVKSSDRQPVGYTKTNFGRRR